MTKAKREILKLNGLPMFHRNKTQAALLPVEAVRDRARGGGGSMIKVIVIERCGDCPYMKWTGETTACLKTGMDVDPLSPDFNKYEAGAGMPDWCPLSKAPQPLVDVVFVPDSGVDEMSYMMGYNECIDVMMGKLKDD